MIHGDKAGGDQIFKRGSRCRQLVRSSQTSPAADELAIDPDTFSEMLGSYEFAEGGLVMAKDAPGKKGADAFEAATASLSLAFFTRASAASRSSTSIERSGTLGAERAFRGDADLNAHLRRIAIGRDPAMVHEEIEARMSR